MKNKALLASPLALIPVGTHAALAAPVHRTSHTQPAAQAMTYTPSWAGFYVGANLGGVSEHSALTGFTPNATGAGYCFGGGQPQFGQPCASGSQTATGVLGGLQAGYNFVSGQWVYGAETDFDLSNARKQTNGLNAPNAFLGNWIAKTGIKDFGTARLRLGYDFNDVMPFVTGGLAYARTVDSFSAGSGFGPPYAFNGISWRAGYTVGGGVEVMLSRNISIKGEALYYDLGGQSLMLPGLGPAQFGLTDRMTGALGRIGINYLFR
jgi:outer membrane immunogenic protein